MQEMGETREPMARDCWQDAHKIAEKYSQTFKQDFWVMFAAKPHVQHSHAIVAGWEISIKRPPSAMLGVLVFRWKHDEKRLVVESDLCLPYDVPLSEAELSKNDKDYVPQLEQTAKKSNAIILA